MLCPLRFPEHCRTSPGNPPRPRATALTKALSCSSALGRGVGIPVRAIGGGIPPRQCTNQRGWRTASEHATPRVSSRRRRRMELNVMNVRPLHDRIIVHRLEEGEQQIGGIIIPDTAKEKPQQGTVIAAGNGKVKDDRKRIPLDVKAGDRILFGKYAGQEITLDGEEYLIMKEDDVLAIIEGQPKKKHAAIKGKTKNKKKKKKKTFTRR